MKVAALFLGPAGVGLIGILTNLMTTANSISGVGVGTVGTRQIAEAASLEDLRKVFVVRRALLWLTLFLAGIGGLLFFLLRNILAAKILNAPELAGELAWLSIGVTLSVASASQNALLNGMRRISDIARVSIGSAILSTVAAITAVWCFGESAIVVFVVSAPIATFVLGHWFVSRLPKVPEFRMRCREMFSQWRAMLSMGIAFMVAGLAGTLGQLIVRAIIHHELGVNALGHFQAAWAISMTYIGFVLGAMGTDYYPRLTAAIKDPVAVNRLVNEQMEVAILLAAPVLIGMLAAAPLVIPVLYSAKFEDAVWVLRWQVLGDMLKIASWPLGFILLAAGAAKTVMITEWVVVGVFCALTYLLLPVIGIAATGIGFFVMYVSHLSLMWILAVRRTGFVWRSEVKRYALFLLACGLIINALAIISDWVAASVGIVLAVWWSGFGLVRLAHAGELRGWIGKLALLAKSVMAKFGVMGE